MLGTSKSYLQNNSSSLLDHVPVLEFSWMLVLVNLDVATCFSSSEGSEVRVNMDLGQDSNPGGDWNILEGIGLGMLDNFMVGD